MRDEHSLIPPHGVYRKLRSFQTAQQVYDATLIFCNRFVDRYSRTRDQMIPRPEEILKFGIPFGHRPRAVACRTSRSASLASVISQKTELKLTGVARASLEELLLDYEDFLRQRGLK